MSDWKDRLALYDQLISKCPNFERKGKTMPYTSANGHMFSLLNKAGEIGDVSGTEVKTKFITLPIHCNFTVLTQT